MKDKQGIRSPGLAVGSLALGAFASVTTEFIPVGILPDVADTFHISSGHAGLMMTLPGLLGALAAPGVLMAAGSTDRKRLLLSLSALLFASALISALAPSWTVMLIGRALAGMSMGAFWAMGLAAAGSLVSEEKAGTAIAAVFGGVTAAMVLGVPMGTLVSGYFSWRGAFIAASVLAALAFMMQAVLLPQIQAGESVNLRALGRFLLRPRGRKSVILIALSFATHFATYTFIAPLMRKAGIGTDIISWTLLGFGVSGFIANFVASRIVDQHLKQTLTAGLVLMAGSLAIMAVSHSHLLLVVAVLIWGAAWGAIPLCLNLGNRQASDSEAEAGSAMFTFTAQVSIAAGSAGAG
ncbi:MFS transporter [Candidatus Pantoea bituminis]|uniref:MFS transporter n=1 Tax=Candidatus Pantoea bituminis TaxID=2831036 RepID=UPI001C05F7BE|nr:MFS transporter [Pantoea bituminis]